MHAQLCLALFDSMDWSPPGSSVHGILQAKILEWVAIPFSRGSSWSRYQNCVFCIACWQTDSLPLSHPGSPLDRLEQWAKYIDRYRYGYGWASLVAQLVKHLPAMQETLVQFLGQEYIIYNPWRRDILPTPVFLGFPGGSVSKESNCNTGNLGSAPGLGRSPWRGHGNPLQYSCLQNPHGQGSLAGYSPWGRTESDTTEWLSTAPHMDMDTDIN